MKNKLLALIGAAILVSACETGTGDTQDVNVVSAAPGTAGDFKANIRDRVFFGFNKSNVTPEAKKVLEAQATWLKTYPATKVVVEGYCDARGTREYNLALGERRANEAKKALVGLGVDVCRMKTVSYGKDRPLVPGDSEEAYAQNRAAVTVVQ